MRTVQPGTNISVEGLKEICYLLVKRLLFTNEIAVVVTLAAKLALVDT